MTEKKTNLNERYKRIRDRFVAHRVYQKIIENYDFSGALLFETEDLRLENLRLIDGTLIRYWSEKYGSDEYSDIGQALFLDRKTVLFLSGPESDWISKNRHLPSYEVQWPGDVPEAGIIDGKMQRNTISMKKKSDKNRAWDMNYGKGTDKSERK